MLTATDLFAGAAPAGGPTDAEWRARDRALNIHPHNDLISEACTWGKSGRCTTGHHHDCAHRPGGSQHHGVVNPSSYVQLRLKNGWLGVVTDNGLPIEVGPWHTWRCDCLCHTEAGLPGEQLALDFV